MKATTIFRVSIAVLVVLAAIALYPYVQGFFPSAKKSVTPTAVPTATMPATLDVQGTQWGQSTCYIGAVEGSSQFNIADMRDLGLNTYRLYGGMQRWEPQDDDGVYGSPTIQQIKENPAVINWAAWDKIMTNPPKGSDYWWVGGTPSWQGNARTLLSSLQKADIRTVITLRNWDEQNHPSWAPNPPHTQADWNEWWEYVFALVYWLNVRNHYDINDFEVHNEPNIFHQGWHGSEGQYLTFVKYTHDAIDFVYRTYLPGRQYHIYAPAISAVPGGKLWPRDALQQVPDSFDSLSVHVYDNDITSYTEQVHTWLDQTNHSNYPVWLTEWGSFTKQYTSIPFSVDLLNNLIRGSRPGKDYIYGSQIFSLYDYATNFTGLISSTGQRRPAYFAMRMGIRALQGCRPTYQSTTSTPDVQSITTKDNNQNLYLLVSNTSGTNQYTVSANLAKLRMSGAGTMWQFDATHMDTVVGKPQLRNGRITFVVPANCAVLFKFAPA